jgi:hypothetical protein
MTIRLPALAGFLLLLAAAPLLADEAEDNAVKAVEKLSGRVEHDDKAPGKPVAAVDLHECKRVTDASLKELAGLKGLQTLNLLDCKGVTYPGVAELQKALPDCKITR